jgi:excisionase family DNA binding protein
MSVQTQTVSVDEAAIILGISRDLCYREIAKTGELCGVPAIRIGGKRIRLPRARLMAVASGASFV